MNQFGLRAFESRAGEGAEAGATAVGFCLEQLSAVFGGAGAASVLAAGGPVAGGVGQTGKGVKPELRSERRLALNPSLPAACLGNTPLEMSLGAWA